MGIKVTSKRLNGEFQRRRNEFAQSLSAVLAVPPEFPFFYFQEHGTALRGERPTHAFDIEPINAKVLSWVGDAGRRVYMDYVKNHPGIPAKHFIANSREAFLKAVAASIAQAMVESGYQYSVVKEAFLSIGMEEVKRIITDAIAETLDQDGGREGGKLQDTAADVFSQNAYIEDRS